MVRLGKVQSALWTQAPSSLKPHTSFTSIKPWRLKPAFCLSRLAYMDVSCNEIIPYQVLGRMPSFTSHHVPNFHACGRVNETPHSSCSLNNILLYRYTTFVL